MIKLLGLSEAHSKYQVYHNSYTSALQEVLDYVKKYGYTVDDDDWFRRVSTGPKKPSEGKTNRFVVDLYKDGKETRRTIAFQVYGMQSQYELNMYIS